MFFERDYDLLPRTYSIKSYRKKESKLVKKLPGLIAFFLILSSITFLIILFFVK